MASETNINHKSDKEIALAILGALAYSKLAKELKNFRGDIQELLGLNDENMNQFYSLPKLFKVLRSPETYKPRNRRPSKIRFKVRRDSPWPSPTCSDNLWIDSEKEEKEENKGYNSC